MKPLSAINKKQPLNACVLMLLMLTLNGCALHSTNSSEEARQARLLLECPPAAPPLPAPLNPAAAASTPHSSLDYSLRARNWLKKARDTSENWWSW